jgi:subtilase family serine protease
MRRPHERLREHRALALLLSVPVALTIVPASQAFVGSTPIRPNPRAPRALRIGSAPRLPAGAKVIGTVPAAKRISVTITLRSRDPEALAAYATDVATPGSALYHRYLTVPQFRARFGATDSLVRDVASRLRAYGLRVGRTSPNNLSIPLHGTAAQLASAFRTSFQRIRLHGGQTAIRNLKAPLLPSRIARRVEAVIGLNTLVRARPMALSKPATAPESPAYSGQQPLSIPLPNSGGGPQPCSEISQYATLGDGPHTQDQIATAYGFDSLYPADEGSGQTVAIYELQPYESSDISAFQSCYGITTGSVKTVICAVCTAPGTDAGSLEATLDIEDVVGLAPEANVLVYEGTNASSDQYSVYSAMVTDDIASVLSTSWGLCEANAGYADSENTLFQEAATQGQSIFAASGDLGSEACGGSTLAVQDPAGQPYLTAVGATNLTSVGPPPTETVWNDFNSGNQGQNEDSSGGISSRWQMPSYQSNAKGSLGVVNSNSSGSPCGAPAGTDCREVPDVVADGGGATGYLFYWNGDGEGAGWYTMYGTSAAAPTWAGYITLVDASSACNGTPVGFVNPDLYTIASNAWNGTAYTADFHDVTVGDNNPDDYTNPNAYPYEAGTGYDLASGLGSMNGGSLTAALCPGPGSYTLNLQKAGSGMGTVASADGYIACGSTCSHLYASGTEVTLTATPTAGSTFAGWSGGGCSGTGSCEVTMNANTTVTATFAAVPTFTLSTSKTGSGSGTVTSAPAGINCGTTCAHAFLQGTSVTLTATPDTGSSFNGWIGACTGTATCTVTTDSNAAVTATFTRIPPPKKCVVPKLKGKAVAVAKRSIKSHDCSVGRINHRASRTVKKGHVVSQKPRPNARLRHGAKVNLVVSKGP